MFIGLLLMLASFVAFGFVFSDHGGLGLFILAVFLLLIGIFWFAFAVDSADFVVRFESYKITIERRAERATELERAAIYAEIADTNARLASYQYWYHMFGFICMDSKIAELTPIK